MICLFLLPLNLWFWRLRENGNTLLVEGCTWYWRIWEGLGGKEGEMLSFQVKDRKRGYWDTYKLKIWIREGNEDLSLSWKLCTNSATPSHQVICCHWFFKFAIPAEVVVIFKLSILLRHWACLGVLVLFPSCDHFSFSSKKGPNTSILFWWLSHHHSFGYECFCLSV